MFDSSLFINSLRFSMYTRVFDENPKKTNQTVRFAKGVIYEIYCNVFPEMRNRRTFFFGRARKPRECVFLFLPSRTRGTYLSLNLGMALPNSNNKINNHNLFASTAFGH